MPFKNNSKKNIQVKKLYCKVHTEHHKYFHLKEYKQLNVVFNKAPTNKQKSYV